MTDETKDTEEQMTGAETQGDAAEPAENEATGGEEEFKFVEPPVFEIDYKGECAYEVKVSIPVANEKKLAEDSLEELRKRAELPGFRRGKAPKKLIERRFGKALKADVESQLIGAAFRKLVDDNKLAPMGEPDVDGLDEAAERKEEEPFTFTLKFDVRPRVELGKYRGLEMERPILKIEDSNVDQVIENARSRHSTFETVAEGEAAEGDQVVIDFTGTIDGVEFPGGAATDYPYILGSKRFFTEFEQALYGKKPGETTTCKVPFPEDYHSESLRGKVSDFTITIKELKRRMMPEVNDEFAKQSGFDTLAEMRQNIEESLKNQAREQGNAFIKNKLLEKVVEASTFEIPKSLIKSMAHDIFEERMSELTAARVPVAEVEQREAAIREGAETSALSTLKSWVVLNEIAEAEGIEVTDADFEREAAALAHRHGLSVDAAAKFLGQEGRRGNYEMRILHEKVLDAIVSHATIEDKELNEEEYKKLASAEDDEAS